MGNVLQVGADIRLHHAVLSIKILSDNFTTSLTTTSLTSTALTHTSITSAIKEYIIHYESECKLYFIKISLGALEAFCSSELGQVLKQLAGVVPCVGSGAWRLEAALKQLFPLATFQRHREAPCLLAGLSVFPCPLFRFVPERDSWDMSAADVDAVQTEPADLPEEPYLLVTMKSGCSFFRVADAEITRVGGSSVGGCTFNALIEALVPDGLQAELGESVDLTVGDIYGAEEVPASLNLPSHIIASVFGKARPEASPAAVTRSIYNLLAINTAQLAFLHASLVGCSKIVFAFIQGQEVQYRMNKFLQFWSKGTIQTVFCTHPDLLASAGTLVLPGDSTTYEEHRFDETCTSLQLSMDEAVDVHP